MGDMWSPEERGQAVAIYSLAPLLGPVVGPIAGGWIAEKSTWRWVFWSTSIAAFVIQIVANKYNPPNYWSGRWRSEYVLDLDKGEARGTVLINVHYYEQGNVRTTILDYHSILTLIFVAGPTVHHT